jgi:hypothetical protein
MMIRLVLGAVLLLMAAGTPSLAQDNNGAAREGQGLPENFHGKISYFGNHSGEVKSTRTIRDGPRRDCPRPDGGCPERIGGSLEIELEFDGDIVKGSFRGTGGLRESGLIGRRIGSMCRLYDLTDGSVWAGRCDTESFMGAVKSVPNSAVQVTVNFEAVSTKVRDYSEWERRRREAIARKRRYERLQATLNGNGPIESRFPAAIELDSYGWQYERLRAGSIRNVTRTKAKRGVYQVSAEYTLDNGATGWARGQIENEIIVCVEYSDLPGVCRPLNAPTPPEEPEDKPPAEVSSWILPKDIKDEVLPTQLAWRLLSKKGAF